MNDNEILELLQEDMNVKALLVCMERAYSRTAECADTAAGIAAAEAKLAEWSDGTNTEARKTLCRAWNLTHAIKLAS